SFYREVWRVLKPGGRFLYADSIETNDVGARVAFLEGLGLEALERRDVTANVLRSCERRLRGDASGGADRTLELLGGNSGGRQRLNPFLSNLTAMPGSHKYEKYAGGAELYLIFDFRKPPIPARD